MKKCREIFISIILMWSSIMTGCAREASVEEKADLIMDAYKLMSEGRVMEIVDKDTVLINVLKENRDFQIGDTLAIKYDVSKESDAGLDSLEGFEGKRVEVQVGNIVEFLYDKHAKKKRDIGGIKDCNFISTWYLYVIPEERYESMHSDDAD